MLLDPRHRPGVITPPDRAARRFCAAVLLWAATAWAAVAALNFIVNPYAQYPTRLVPPRVRTSRAQKLQLFHRMQPAPEGLILGSSRVMKLQPDYLRALTGYEFFNAGVNYGKPEDALAWVRYYEQRLGRAPRMIVLGLDVTAFADDSPVDARLLSLPALAGQVPEALRWRDRGRRWQELLSWQQTRASLQSLLLLASGAGPGEVDESFCADGLLIYHLREQQMREGRYDFAAALQDNQREYRQLYDGYDRLSRWRCRLLESLMRWCREREVRLVLFTTPMHPQLVAALQDHTTYEDRRRELVSWLQPVAERYACRFHDLSEIATFAGDAQAFVDGVHPLEANTRRMIDRLAGSLPANTPMLFNSCEFIFLFLPLCLVLWWQPRWTAPQRLGILVLASYLFYGWWDYRFVPLLLLSTLVDYRVGRYLSRAQNTSGRILALMLSLAVNLGLLGFFKYSGFLASSLNAVVAGVSGAHPLPVWEIVLPVGISFYTFQTLSYTIDIYRRQARPADSFLQFAAYVSLFPQLIAGPIVRYGQLQSQLRCLARHPAWQQMARGLFFFVAGLSQKLLLADLIAARVNPLLADYQSLRLCGSWFAMLGYSCQLYFDFAGYSNMAVGLGLMLGLELPQNFASPYQSRNIAEFWRRWHITLSTWLRDYLFIPLGGSRLGSWVTLRNLILVMFLGGLWHGAGWTFVLWGLYHGALLTLHRYGRERRLGQVPEPLAVAATFVAVVFGWVLFRSVDLAMSCHLWAAMIGSYGCEAGLVQSVGGVASLTILAFLLAIVFAAPNLWQLPFRPTRRWAVGLALLLVVCVLRLDSESPFLYFQF